MRASLFRMFICLALVVPVAIEGCKDETYTMGAEDGDAGGVP